MDSNRQPLIDFLTNTPHHDLSIVFDILELAMDYIVFDSIEEQSLMEQFMTSFWVATKRER